MQPDLIIGNPPYDKDIYLDFVTQAHSLSTDSTVMITPAKWQAKAGKKNEDFRQEVVPYMRDIVYYPDTKEVFDISSPGGVTYFDTSKTSDKHKRLKVCCLKNKSLTSDFEDVYNLKALWGNKIRRIIDKCVSEKYLSDTFNFKASEYVDSTNKGYKVRQSDTDVEVVQGSDIVGFMPEFELKTTEGLSKYKVTLNVMPGAGVVFLNDDGMSLGMNRLNLLMPNQVPKGSYFCLFTSDNIEECESVIQYCNTNLVRFLHYLGVCSTSVTSEFFRFIPTPTAFDHTFTDEELYTRYNLTPDEIQLIESVIKTRTKKA